MNKVRSMVGETAQPGILASVPRAGRYLAFVQGSRPARRPAALAGLLAPLSAQIAAGDLVLGLGPDLVGEAVPDMRTFPALCGPGVQVPSTPVSVWCWLRGEDPGELVRRGRAIERQLAPRCVPAGAVDAFRHGRGPLGHGMDLSGYEDGIENPHGRAARAVAFVDGLGPGLDGGSCASVQQWLHDFPALESMDEAARDRMVGRRRSDSQELDDAPPSAHVRRTAQEDFTPPAFVVRRSMPWSAGPHAGLMFVAFGRTPDAFEAQMRRMAGLDDGIPDALFRMSRPITGAHVWCPPMDGPALDLRALPR